MEMGTEWSKEITGVFGDMDRVSIRRGNVDTRKELYISPVDKRDDAA